MSEDRVSGIYVVIVCSAIVTVSAVMFAALLLSRKTKSLSEMEAIAGNRRPRAAPVPIYVIAAVIFAGLLVFYAIAAFRRGTIAMSGAGIMLALATAAFVPISMFVRDMTFEATSIAFMSIVALTWVYHTLVNSSGMDWMVGGIGWLLMAGTLFIGSCIVRRPLAPASIILEAAAFVLIPVGVQLTQNGATTPGNLRAVATSALARTVAWLLLHTSGSLDLLRHIDIASGTPCEEGVNGLQQCWPSKNRQ